jgi:hypothetical protein
MSEWQLVIVSAAYIVISRILIRNKEKKMHELYKSSRYAMNLLSDLNDTFFKNFTRLSQEDFAILLEIVKQNTFFREAIPSEVRLAVTLRFLASVDSYTSLQYKFKI